MSRQVLGRQILGQTGRRMERLPGGGSSVLYQEPLNAMRIEPIAFPLTAIGAGATEVVTVRPQRLFRGNKLILFGAGLIIEDITTQQRSIFAAPGAVPIEAFGPTVYENNVEIYTVQVGADISVRVNNPTVGAVDFYGVVFGRTATAS